MINRSNLLLNLGFILLCFVFDAALQSAFPVDFELRRTFFVSSLGIVGAMLVSRGQTLSLVLVTAVLSGLIMDLTHYGYFLLYTSVYALTLTLVRFWSVHVNQSPFELLILALLTVFVKEGLIFITMRLIGVSSLTFANWFINREFLTLLVHIPLVLFLLRLDGLRHTILSGREADRRRKEDPLFINMPRRP